MTDAPIRREIRTHTHTHTQRDTHGKTPGEDGHLQTKESGLRRNQPCPHLDLGLLAARTVRTEIPPRKPPKSGCLVVAA